MTPITSSNIAKDKYKYIKRYIKEKDFWMVWHYIFSGVLPEETEDTQIH